MKKLSLAIIALVMVGFVYAQPPVQKDFRGAQGPDLEKMKIILDLTDEQMAQWTELHESHRAAMETRRAEMQIEREIQMEKMKLEREEAMEAHQNQLKKILTPEQYTKFEALRPEHPGPMEGFDRMGRPQGRDGQPEQFNKSDCSNKTGMPKKGQDQK